MGALHKEPSRSPTQAQGVGMAGNNDNMPPAGYGDPPPGDYPPQGGYPPPGDYPPPGGYPPPPPPPPRKKSVGKRILGALVAVALVITVRVGLHAVFNHHSDHSSGNHSSDSGFNYEVGTCLNLSKTGIMVKPSEVQVEPCSAPTALARVAKKYKGTKNCPSDHYGTLEGGGDGYCLEDNLTVGACYNQSLFSHMFEQTACTPGFLPNNPTLKVALRREGVNDPGLCRIEQQVIGFPEPPLTYCMDVIATSR
jgi:hypothetical protein